MSDEWPYKTEHRKDRMPSIYFKLMSHLIEGQKALEISCGNGDLSVEIAKLGFDVVGVDKNKTRIRQAVKLAKKENLGAKARFLKMDAGNLKFHDNSFDAILIPEVLAHVKDSRKLIEEAIRVTKNGGRIIISVPDGLSETLKGQIRVFFKDTLTTELSQYTSEIHWHELPFKKWLICSFFVRKKEQNISKGPLVDIIMPTYNGRKYIRNAIKSILGQTYQNWRLIVANDGGKDVADILGKYHDKRIKYIVTKHKGKAHALNVGIKKSNGKYISYLDDDDILYPIHLEALVTDALKNKRDFVYADGYEVSVDEEGREIRREFEYRLDVEPWMLIRQNYINHKCILHSRALLKKTGMYDEQLDVLIDWDMIRKLAFASKPHHVWRVTSEHLRYYQGDVLENRITGLWTSDPDKARESVEKIANKTVNLLATKEELKKAVVDTILHPSYYHSSEFGSSYQKYDYKFKKLEKYTEKLQKEFDDRTAWAKRLNKELAKSNKYIGKLQKEFDERTAWALKLDKELTQLGGYTGKLQKESNEKAEWALRLDKELTQLREFTGKLQKEFDEKAEWANNLNKELDNKALFEEGLNKELDRLDGLNAELDHELSELKKSLCYKAHISFLSASNNIRRLLAKNRIVNSAASTAFLIIYFVFKKISVPFKLSGAKDTAKKDNPEL